MPRRCFDVARRSLNRAGDIWFLGIAVGLFVLQQVAIRAIGLEGAAGFTRRGIFVGSTVVLSLIALRFRRYLGAWLISGGILLNLVPMIAHGGLMPVSYRVVHASGAFPEITEAQLGKQLENGKDILLREDEIRFEWLSDRYVVDLPAYGTNIYSLGDFVLFAGVALVGIQAAGAGFVGPIRRRTVRPAQG